MTDFDISSSLLYCSIGCTAVCYDFR